MLDTNIYKPAQDFMQQESLSGWLIYDYRGSNPIFQWLLPPSGHITRPCFLFVPADSQPRLLVHHVDAGKFAACGLDSTLYTSHQSLAVALRQMLPSGSSVAMEYSPQGALPRASTVDAGTIELVRSLGIAVKSSADLMQFATQRLSPAQVKEHRQSASQLGEIVNEAFQYTGANLKNSITEFQVAEFIRRRFREEALVSPDGPIVATNSHTSDPHYEPTIAGSNVIRTGDWMLIDLWAKPTNFCGFSSVTTNSNSFPAERAGLEEKSNSLYADITWVGYVGNNVPQQHQNIFNIVTGARDTALKFLEDSVEKELPVLGWQADDAARRYITQRGYGDYFTHRLGHSIGREVHGDAVNLDGFETWDTRRIITGVCFSIEPGIYLPEFGVRSEINAYMSEFGPIVTSPVQLEVVLIQAP